MFRLNDAFVIAIAKGKNVTKKQIAALAGCPGSQPGNQHGTSLLWKDAENRPGMGADYLRRARMYSGVFVRNG